jgi:Golgi nucleoside diphosphatase
MTYILQLCNNKIFDRLNEQFNLQGHFHSMYTHNHYYRWLSSVEFQKVTKSMLIAYIASTVLQIFYTNIPETAFLSFSIHLF